MNLLIWQTTERNKTINESSEQDDHMYMCNKSFSHFKSRLPGLDSSEWVEVQGGSSPQQTQEAYQLWGRGPRAVSKLPFSFGDHAIWGSYIQLLVDKAEDFQIKHQADLPIQIRDLEITDKEDHCYSQLKTPVLLGSLVTIEGELS